MGIYFILICLISLPDLNQNVLESNFYMNKIQKNTHIDIKWTKTFGGIFFTIIYVHDSSDSYNED